MCVWRLGCARAEGAREADVPRPSVGVPLGLIWQVNTFKQEQELYQKEGLQWKEISYSDNRDCLELLQDKTKGLFSLLDDICRMPKPKDEGYLERVFQVCVEARGRRRQNAPVPVRIGGV